MIEATLLSFFLILFTIIWHFWWLSKLITLMPPADVKHSHFFRSVLILILLFLIHITEILWFSLGLYIANEVLNIGYFTEPFQPIFRDYFYYSLVTYSTLGLSEFAPVGHIKVITGLESLTGFIMLTWSATFFYTLINRRPQK